MVNNERSTINSKYNGQTSVREKTKEGGRGGERERERSSTPIRQSIEEGGFKNQLMP